MEKSESKEASSRTSNSSDVLIGPTGSTQHVANAGQNVDAPVNPGDQAATAAPAGAAPVGGQAADAGTPGLNQGNAANPGVFNNRMAGMGAGFFGFLGSFWNSKSPVDEEDPGKFKLLKDRARKTNSSSDYLNLAHLYLIGDTAAGVIPDKAKAIQYYKEAANRGSSIAKFNLGVLFQETDIDYSYQLFTE